MDVLVTQVFNGLSGGSILLLAALGLALTFGQMGVINMAHGEFIMIGAYAAYICQLLIGRLVAPLAPQWGGAGGAGGLDFVVALPVAFLVAALLGWLLEISLIRFLYGRPLDTLLATWGVGLVLQQAARSIFGAPNVQGASPSWLNGGVAVGVGLLLLYKRLFIIVLVFVASCAIYV